MSESNVICMIEFVLYDLTEWIFFLFRETWEWKLKLLHITIKRKLLINNIPFGLPCLMGLYFKKFRFPKYFLDLFVIFMKIKIEILFLLELLWFSQKSSTKTQKHDSFFLLQKMKVIRGALDTQVLIKLCNFVHMMSNFFLRDKV